ncbi:MAG: sodium:calcium antiporter [bacterium]
MFINWFLFIILAVVIYFAGSRLTVYADILGEKWGVHRSFIGLILLSTVTSLPELGTSLSSILWVGSPDLALGNVLGSNLFNVAIIPLLALLYRRAFLHGANNQHNTNAALITLIYALVAGGLLTHLEIFPAWLAVDFWISPFSIAIFIFYLGGIYLIFLEKNLSEEQNLEKTELYGADSQLSTVLLFVFSALLVIIAGAGLARVGKILAVKTGLKATFFGTLFFAFVTSLPEVVVSWAALRELGAVNLALGNIFGSCLFNLAIIFVFDFAVAGPVFAAVSTAHLVSVLAGIMMVSIASYAIHIRRDKPARVFFPLEMVLLSVIYLVALYTIFLLR